MDLAVERDKLRETIEGLDEQLEDLFQLVASALDYELDYTPESVRFLELLLSNLKPDPEDDPDLLIDSALYFGETLKRHHNGTWSISEERTEEKYGQPCVSWQNGEKQFFPFLSIREYAEAYPKDYFYHLFEE